MAAVGGRDAPTLLDSPRSRGGHEVQVSTIVSSNDRARRSSRARAQGRWGVWGYVRTPVGSGWKRMTSMS
jgi:hypothetical protein